MIEDEVRKKVEESRWKEEEDKGRKKDEERRTKVSWKEASGW